MKIKRNVRLAAAEKNRKKWNFSEMKINDVVDITDAKLWPRASVYAHTYAAQKGPKWNFATKWMGKFGRIRRVA